MYSACIFLLIFFGLAKVASCYCSRMPQACFCSKAFTLAACFSCNFLHPSYLHDLLPHFYRVILKYYHLSEASLVKYAPNSTAPNPQHSLSAFLHYFSVWNISLTYLSYLLSFFPPTKCKCHEGKNFCLCLILYPRHLEKCLVDNRH